MCGIIGVVGANDAVEKIISGLKKLEYRGYDSAGLAVLEDNQFKTVKEEGKIVNLEKAVKKAKIFDQKLQNKIAIGHTRWATHGRPSQENAHPHASSQICVVHNGIIENYQEIKSILTKKGTKFLSETDSEIVPHLLEENVAKTQNLKEAIIETLNEIKGSYAFAMMLKNYPDAILIAKKGSPLLIGIGENENYIASDYYAIATYTNKIIYLNDDEFALVYKNKIEIFDILGNKIAHEIKIMESSKDSASKGDFANFMLKEIYEQPQVLSDTIQHYVDLANNKIHLPNFPFDIRKIKKIIAIACGTSYYAALTAKYLFEEIAQIEFEVDIASEFRYRKPVLGEDNLMLFISQSGETADTIAALKYAKQRGQKILSIVNVAQSSMAQLSDVVIKTIAGPEIGVASTKAYTAQIASLALLAIEFGKNRETINAQEQQKLISQLASSSHKIQEILAKENIKNVKKVAKYLTKFRHILYIGRGISYVCALESSLKMRELSYINAQAIAAGELKHGTIALIDKKMPIVALAPTNSLFEKIASNIEEVRARSGKVILVSDEKGAKELHGLCEKEIIVPQISGIIEESLVLVVATQLLAYYVALYKGNDVDQPRNLAKSVTVE